MAVSKVILNGNTLMDVTVDTVTSEKLLTGYQATGRDGQKVQGSYVPSTASFTTGSADPTEEAQHITPPSGYDGFSYFDVGAISSNYVGSNIPQNDSSDLSASGSVITAAAGYYATAASKAVSAGSATTPATSITTNPSISVSATGVITATTASSKSITPTVSAGYISSGTAGTVTVSGSNTLQLDTQATKTVTPTESSQTAVASGKYTLGPVTVAAIPSDYIGSAIASVSVVEGTTTVSGTTATRGQATWSAGVIASGSMPAATFANTSSAETQYVDISATTEAPVLVSGGYLYINKGYTDDLKISLAKLVPDGASADLASGVILSGYAAYDNDGNLVAGNIPTKSSTDVAVSGPTVSVPSGYYGTVVSTTLSSGDITIPSQTFIGVPVGTMSLDTTTGIITTTRDSISKDVITKVSVSGYLRANTTKSVANAVTIGADNTSYQLSTIAAATITPTESSQVAAASGKYTLGPITVAAVSSDYIGSNVTQNSAADLSASGSIVTVPSGYYTTAATKAVSAGSATTPTTTISVTPNITVSTAGLITATVNSSKSITPTISAGYISIGTAGDVTASGSNTSQLTVASASIITPGTADITLASGIYLTGAQTIKGDANLTAANIATGVSIFGITGTHTGFSYTDEFDSHGGTIRHFVTSGSSNPYSWLGQGTIYGGQAYNKTINLKDDTSYDSWEASTTSTTIWTPGTDDIITVTYEDTNYSYWLITKICVNIAYNNGATLVTIPKKVYAYVVEQVSFYPNSMQQLTNGNNYSGRKDTGMQSAVAMLYYSSSGFLSSYGSWYYGPMVISLSWGSSSNSSYLSRNVPNINARCHSSYFAIERKNDIDSANTNMTITADVYKTPNPNSSFAHMAEEMRTFLLATE